MVGMWLVVLSEERGQTFTVKCINLIGQHLGRFGPQKCKTFCKGRESVQIFAQR